MPPSEIERIAKLEERLERQDEVLSDLQKDVKQLLIAQSSLPLKLSKMTAKQIKSAISKCQQQNQKQEEGFVWWKKLATIGLTIGTIIGGILYGINTSGQEVKMIHQDGGSANGQKK